MSTRRSMYTYKTRGTTLKERDPMFRLEQEMRIRNFSRKTVTAYLYCNKELLRFANPKRPLEIVRQDVRDYLDFIVSSGKAEATVNLAINALKFYYDNILARSFFSTDLGIKRPKRKKKLPVVLSKEEIKRMIKATVNLKHKTMLSLLYGCGLRISELVNLKMGDIDIYRKTLHIREAKGGKDRYVNIPSTLLSILRNQCEVKTPEDYLFTGRNNSKINPMSVHKAVKQCLGKAGIAKPASSHSLRHSFATHLLENGVNLRYTKHFYLNYNICTTYTF